MSKRNSHNLLLSEAGSKSVQDDEAHPAKQDERVVLPSETMKG